MSTKRSAVSGAPTPTKVSVATTRVSKSSSRGAAKSNADAASPLQTSRLSSVDRSPRSLPSKPALDRRSPKLTTPPEKKATRVSKPSQVQPELDLAQEELKKAEEKLVLVQNEKDKALDELKEARRLGEEANEKLREALIAQKRAEESSEIEKFRAVEMEQAGIEAAQRNEEEWQKELETLREKHAVDVAALLSATEEIQKVKQELALIIDAKDQALQHVQDATKIAEAHAQKVEALSAELAHMKSVLDSRVEMEASENDKFVSELKSEIDSLNQQLEKAEMLEEKLAEKEAILEQLNVDLEAAKMAESYARNLVDELQEKVEELASQAEQAKRLERSASESLESVIKQLEGSNDSLHDAESQIGSLKEKVVLLEISIERQKRDLEESDILLELAKEEASEMAKQVESLRSELEILKEEKAHSLNNEKLAAENVQTLLEEKNKLINELGNSRDEEEKTKRALESLASALHEVSSEARDAKEKLLSFQVEHENYETQIEDLKLVLKGTNEKYEGMLGDAKQEIEALTNSIEQSKHDDQNLKAEWEQKELQLMNSIKKSEEEKSSVESEINRLVNLLKMAEEEACATREEEERWKNLFKEAESEAIYLKDVLGEAKAESMRLKEGLMDRENELQNILQENDELRKREASSLKKIEELSKLLEEAPAKKHGEENGELTDSEKDYDMLPKVVEFYEQNGTGEVKPKVEDQSQETELPAPAKETLHEVHDVINDEFVLTASKMENSNGGLKDNELEKDHEDATEVDLKMWDSCNIEEKDYSPERETEQESFEDEVEHKAEGTDSYEQGNGQSTDNLDNGGSSPTKQNSLKKKKKPLLHKFGNLLKKKGTTNQK
ncbi:WEB family protein At5g16730, chloroplastic-like [Salvia miltiorrhiza]|uniref:WEB family protein At5g16730, chloroplastic-like n=1 Tax=Salvia miltiorrhiza TaxID=226208 RepID=UPI0025AD3267|nr:WEB family protein At5g16730, chloroplastic-like [Salvia miltiorrhiza]